MKSLSFRATVQSGATLLSTNTWQAIAHRVEKPLTSLLLTFGLAAFNSAAFSTSRSIAASADSPQAADSIAILATKAQASQKSPSSQPLADGVYLYGQSPERDRLGSAYLVFEVNDGQVVGAFYMPRSSFDCFQGRFADNQLALTIRETYSQEEYAYALALEPTDAIASANGEATPVSLTGYHPITTLNDNDRRILSTCKTDLQ